MRKLVLVSVILGSLVPASSAQATITSALGVNCTVNGTDQVRECGGTLSTTPSWDGTPIDVNVAFPPDPGSGDGNYPLIIWGHGYGGSKISFSNMRRFTSRGFAVFSMSDRGFHDSCGTPTSITAGGSACDNGFIHLMDDRFEVRDAQFLAGELADQGLVDGQHVGAVGGSYGGGLSLQLAALKDRVMRPDGQLIPWVSPANSIPMRVAGAAPDIPWSDLAYSLAPNGGTLDYVADNSYTGRIGIQKQSLVNGLFISGSVTGRYCGQAPYPACTDPQADLMAWKARLDAGEPYDGDPTTTSVFDEIKAHHSGYYVDHSEPPAPLMISNGFTDDLFPADEAIKFYNRTRSQYPNTPLSLFFGDFGHPRSANKSADSSARDAAQNAWLDYYVKGTGLVPFQGVTTYAMTCPSSAPSAGPFNAGSWGGLRKGEVRFKQAAAQTISPSGGSPTVDATWDPATAGGNPCTSTSSNDLSGIATYRLPAATGAGYTLMGSPTVIARISSPTANSELAARLLDVSPSGTETLVDRQLFRPMVGTAMQVFQLHPSGHLFAAGHVPKLELLPRDSGGASLNSYGHPANGQGQITVAGLDLRLPVLEGPGGQVRSPAPLLLPCGSGIAPGFSSDSYLRAARGDGKVKFKGKTARVPVDSAPGSTPCRVQVDLIGSVKGTKARSAKKRKKRANVLGRATVTIAGGDSKVVKLKLGKRGRSAVSRGRKVRVKVTTLDAAGNTVQITKLNKDKKHKKHKKHKRK